MEVVYDNLHVLSVFFNAFISLVLFSQFSHFSSYIHLFPRHTDYV